MFTQLSTYYKRQAKYVLGREEDLIAQFALVPSQDITTDNPEIHFENLEDQETLYSNIRDHLTPKESETLIKRFFHEVKYKILAQQLGDLSVSATKVRTHRALRKLRKVYQNHSQ
jgi:RNA polymerase sigma factor (sigma-70 family)